MIAASMSAAILLLLAIGAWCARDDFAKSRGIDKVVALTPVCFGASLAAFGAEHFAGAIPVQMVPSYMPLREFWVYFVGVALVAAALSIATGVGVRWSGLLLGLMMFLFVVMLYLPSALKTGNRITWTIVFRELSFGAGGLVLARHSKPMRMFGVMLIAATAILFGVQHFLHPLALPVVPLLKEMPTWIPARAVIDYVTGAFLIAGGIAMLKSRAAAAYLGAWILLLIVVMYVPLMISALLDPKVATQVEGLNYFADTVLFAGVILSAALPATHTPGEAHS